MQEKQQKLLKLLKERTFLKTQDIVEYFQMSEASARRLMKHIQNFPNIYRYHGGIAFNHSMTKSPNTQFTKIKKALAQHTAKNYVKDNQIIFISSGITTSYLKDFLGGFSNLTVITNNLLILDTLIEFKHIELILTGGIVTRDVPAMYDSFFPIEFLTQKIVIDAFFLTSGYLNERGCSDRNTLETQDLKRIMSLPGEKYLLADHSKIDTYKPFIWGSLSDFTKLITNDQNTQALENLRVLIDIDVVSIKDY